MRPTLKVAEADLRALTERLLVAAGASDENAREAAEIFLDADVKGIGAQGIDYMYYIIDSLKRGLIDGQIRDTNTKVMLSSALPTSYWPKV